MDKDLSPIESEISQVREISVSELVSGVRLMLGARLAAYIAGVKTTSQLTVWIEAEKPELTVSQMRRLQLAYVIASVVSTVYDSTTMQSWFIGMNPALDDVAPARFIVETDGLDSDSVMAALFDMH